MLDGAVAFCAAGQPPPTWTKMPPAPASWGERYVGMLREIAEPEAIRVTTSRGVVAGRTLTAVVTDLDLKGAGKRVCEVFDPLVEVDADADAVASWAGRRSDDLPFSDRPGDVRVRWAPGLSPNARTSEVTIVSPRLNPTMAEFRGGLAYAAEIRPCARDTGC